MASGPPRGVNTCTLLGAGFVLCWGAREAPGQTARDGRGEGLSAYVCTKPAAAGRAGVEGGPRESGVGTGVANTASRGFAFFVWDAFHLSRKLPRGEADTQMVRLGTAVPLVKTSMYFRTSYQTATAHPPSVHPTPAVPAPFLGPPGSPQDPVGARASPAACIHADL